MLISSLTGVVMNDLKLIKPKKINAGDTVAAISLSWGGASVFPHRYQAGKKQLEESFGLKVIETPHALAPASDLAAQPQLRASDLHWAFENPDVKAVIAIIGGDDSVRLIDHVDVEILRKHPKIFMGYSDSTVTHFQCLKAGLTSIYGPSIMAGFAENGGLFDYMKASVHQTLFSTAPLGDVTANMNGWTDAFLDWGNPDNQPIKRPLKQSSGYRFLQGERAVTGHLIGGCVEVLEMLKGTTLWPDKCQWDGAILFLETSEEAPSQSYVVRCLRNYAATGILEKLSGIILGRPANLKPEQIQQYDEAIEHVVAKECGLNHMPIITQMDFGHTDPMGCLPYGVQARIDPVAKKFELLDSAVS